MKKITKVISVAMAGLMIMSSASALTVSAAKKEEVHKSQVVTSNTKSGVKITWAKVDGASKYELVRKVSGAKSYTSVKTLSDTDKLSVVDKTVKAGKKYLYAVKVYKGSSYEYVDKSQSVVRLEAPKLKVNSDNKISFKWNKVKGAKRYEIYCAKVKNGKTKKYNIIDITKKNKYVYWMPMSGEYKFKVRAVSGNSYSDYSKEIKIDYLEKPTLIATVSRDYSGVDLNWYKSSKAEGYRIYRSENKQEKGKLLVDLKTEDCIKSEDFLINDYVYQDKDVEDLVKYYYTIEAYKGKKTASDTSSVKYMSAALVLKVGQTNKELSKSLSEAEELIEEFEEEGIKIQYEFASEDESIFTVDEKGNITGVAPGKAKFLITIKGVVDTNDMEIEMDMVLNMKMPIKVIEA